jgi:cysteine desulfurase/selenocysteine lyase
MAPSTPVGLLPELEVLRKDFPILSRTLAGGQPLVYLDSANTSQKPQVVIDTMVDHLERHNANVARAMHQLGAEASEAFEDARDKVASFINAPSRDEVIFTKNASEALNLVANTLAWATGDLAIGAGDEVVITEMEHHSNIVPWQLLTERKGATLRWFGLTDDGRLDLSDIDDLITDRTKVVSLTWVSNMLGTVNPVAEIARRAHEVGAIVVVDASQAAPQLPVDVVESGADLLAFTGHKVVGPTGIGVLWGRRAVLDQLPPFLGGGEMIETVAMQRSTFAGIPHKFEAGTPPIVEAVGLGAAVDYLSHIGMENIHRAGAQRPGSARRVGAWRRHLVRDRRRAPARRGPGARLAGDRRTRRSPLREAGPRAVRGAELDADVVVPLHDAGGDRRARRRTDVHPLLLQAGDRGMSTANTDLDALYQEIILDHYKNPHHKGLRDPYEAEVHHVNPTCGDEVTLRVHLADGVVADVSYDSVGCSISQASASVLTDLVIGKPVDEAMSIHQSFLTLMQGRGNVEPDEDVLEDGIAFAGVAKFPARVKCALLSWMAWKDATASAVELEETMEESNG